MTKYTTVFTSLLRPLSRSEFENAVLGYKGDFKIRVLSCWDLFKSMLYALISSCFSVREIEASMRANRNRLYHAGLKQIKRSTFCDALEKRRHDIFKRVFDTLVTKAQTISGQMKKKFKDPLRIIDATVISVCLKRFNWAKYRKSKGAVKVHLNLDGDRLIPFDAYITNGTVHDVKEMKNLTGETGVIYAMDRGYVDYKSLYSIELQGSVFVTRMKRNGAFKRIHKNRHKEGGPVLSDVIIELTGTGTKKAYPKPIRKIKYKDKETKKEYEFMTNDMEREAEEIAAIYKERWEVDLFFKWIKQHLKIKSFWGQA
jgi:IS4 transposase